MRSSLVARRLLELVILFASVGSPVGCGKKDAVSRPPFVPTDKSVALGPAGGAVDLAGSDGTTYTLDVPKGALARNTTVSLTTFEPAGDDLFRVVVGPPGLVFEPQTAATLTIRLPGGRPLAATGGILADGVFVPFTRNGDSSVSVKIRATSSVDPAGSGAKTASTRSIGRVASRATVAACGTPTASSTGITGADVVDISLYAQCMAVAIDELDRTGRFEAAVRANLTVASLLQRLGGSGAGDAQTFIDAATKTACRARKSAFDAAAAATIDSLGQYYPLVRRMAYWESITQRLGATCEGASFSDAAAALTAKAVDLFKAKRSEIKDTKSASYGAAVSEAIDGRNARREISALDPPPTLAASMDTHVKERAERTLVDALLDGPWTDCHTTGEYKPLVALMDALAWPELAGDLAQYCGTAIEAEAFGAGSSPTSLGKSGTLGDSSRSVRVTTATVKAAPDGTVKLTGIARALSCPPAHESPEALVLTMNGREVKRLTGASYVPADLDVKSLLETAGLDPANPGAQQTITITREGDACGGYWGTNPSPLATLILSFSQQRIAYECWTAGVSDICVINGDGTGWKRLTSIGAERPSWSPDGKKIVFGAMVGSTSYGSIRTINADGTGESILTTTDGDRAPAWSPDGKKIAFTAARVGGFVQVWVMGADGSGQTALTTTGTTGPSNGFPAWSPDSKQIAFQTCSTSTCKIAVMNADGSGSRMLPHATKPLGAPAWSPDGKQIAFNGRDGAGVDRIYIMNSDGTGEAVVPSTLDADTGPAWSPDGKRMAFSGFKSGLEQIYVRNLDGTGLLQLTTAGEVKRAPAWSN